MSRGQKLVIGITGTNGSGKGTVVDRLVDRWDFVHQSTRAVISEEIEKRGLPVNRDNLIQVAYDLRTKNSPDIFIRRMYKKAEEEGGNHVLESLRSPAEVDFLKKRGNFKLIAVDADVEERFRRIKKRGGDTDNETFDSFLEKEEKEMKSTDPNKQNIRACIEKADYTLQNNGTVEELNQKVDKIMEEIM